MHEATQLTNDQAVHLLPLIRGKVRKFIGDHRRDAEVRQDLVQESYLRILSRLSRFNPQRGSLGDFVAQIVDSVLIDHHRYCRAEKRDRRRERQSLQAKTFDSEGQVTELAKLIAAEDHERDSKIIDLLFDVAAALDRLSPAERKFCEQLKTLSVAEAAAAEGVDRGTGYRRLQSIQVHLRDDSLREYLD